MTTRIFAAALALAVGASAAAAQDWQDEFSGHDLEAKELLIPVLCGTWRQVDLALSAELTLFDKGEAIARVTPEYRKAWFAFSFSRLLGAITLQNDGEMCIIAAGIFLSPQTEFDPRAIPIRILAAFEQDWRDIFSGHGLEAKELPVPVLCGTPSQISLALKAELTLFDHGEVVASVTHKIGKSWLVFSFSRLSGAILHDNDGENCITATGIFHPRTDPFTDQ